MAAKKKGRGPTKYPTAWRQVGRSFLDKYEVHVRQNNVVDVYAIYEEHYERRTGPAGRGDIERQVEVQKAHLNYALAELDISQQGTHIISLATGGFVMMKSIFERYFWQQEQKAQEALAQKKLLKHQRRNSPRLLSKKFGRQLEL